MDGPSFAGSVVLVMLFMLIRHQVLGRWAQVPAEASVVGEHTAEAMLAAVQYLGKLLLPVGLRPTYQYPDLTVLRVLLAASTLVWLGVLIVRSRRRYPMFFFTGLWILIALSPVLHFVPLEPFPFFADRFMYVPLVGVAVLATWAAERWRASRPLLYLWGGALVFMTTSALDPWESDAALWAHAVRQDPSNAFAWVNYADTLQDPRLRETAYRRALQTRPNADMAFAIMNNLAHVSNAQRNGWQGRYWAQKALRLAPDSKTARYNLARAALLEKDWIAAEREIKRLQSLAGPRDPSVKALKTALSNRR
jgi:tetratricopeptide (TPR) repeat protein